MQNDSLSKDRRSAVVAASLKLKDAQGFLLMSLAPTGSNEARFQENLEEAEKRIVDALDILRLNRPEEIQVDGRSD